VTVLSDTADFSTRNVAEVFPAWANNPVWSFRTGSVVGGGIINYDQVEKALGPLDEFKVWEVEDIKAAILLAVETWLPFDLAHLSVHHVEHRIDDPTKAAKTVADVLATVGTEQYPVVIDWKWSANLDAKWVERQRYGMQAGIYSLLCGDTWSAPLIWFRGICPPVEVTNLLVTNGKDRRRHAANGLELTLENLNLLVGKNGGGTWPRNLPGACFAFKRPCPYYEDCAAAEFPDHGAVKGQFITMSKTLYDKLLLCPERARRYLLIKKDTYDPDVDRRALISKIFHRGMAEVYRQAFKLSSADQEGE